MEFKSGDKVVMLNDCWMGTFEMGQILTLSKLRKNWGWDCVEVDKNGKHIFIDFPEDKFELAQPYLQQLEAKKLLGLK